MSLPQRARRPPFAARAAWCFRTPRVSRGPASVAAADAVFRRSLDGSPPPGMSLAPSARYREGEDICDDGAKAGHGSR